jgi:hypothetical protein
VSACFTSIRGRMMRVTKVDNAGRPAPGTCSVVTTKGFVSLAMASETDEGSDLTVTLADGSTCVSEPGTPTVKWITITAEFCNVDPDLLTLINPTWTKLLDRNGDTIGWEESLDVSTDAGFALEVWADVSGYTPTEVTADGAWVYYLLPYLSSGTLGDITVENGAASFTVTGRTKKGSQWGRGPYNVMANAPDGRPGPLITPFSPAAPRRIFLTTVKPPAAVCGCQPLSSSTGPVTTVVEVTSDTTRQTVRAYASGAGPFTVDWGDGTVEDLAAGITGKTHRYGKAGTYIVATYPTADPSDVTYKPVTVPYAGTTPAQPLLTSLTELGSDATRKTGQVQWDNTGFGTVRINWGDGTVDTNQAETGTRTHAYTANGSYLVTVSDSTDSSRAVTQTVNVPWGPIVTVTENVDDLTNRRTANAVVNNYGYGQVTIDWGESGASSATNAGDGIDTSTYTYTTGGTYTVTVTDITDPSRTATASVTVPFNTLQLQVVEANPPGSPRRKVTATWSNQGSGGVTIKWGESGETATAAGESGSLTHTYTASGTYTVTVTDADDSLRTATQQITVPFS